MNHESITIFTDGSSRGNPGPGGYAAIIILPQNNNGAEIHDSRFMIHELGGREEHTTNNRMELRAAIEALRLIHDSRFTIQVFSDSGYVINGITKWVFGWRKNGWVTTARREVENRDLWEKLIELTRIYRSIDWKRVGGHVGVSGNERCDQIARMFADATQINADKIKLYRGPLSEYPIKNILDFSESNSAREKKESSKKRNGAKAYSYLSMVNGAIRTHKTWAECEKRVKGQSGTKFKKSFSPEDEKKIISQWQQLR